MALDGIYLYNLINELKDSLINSRIDKINQPEKDEIIINVRGKENKKLLISSSSKYPRLHFTTISKNNPLQPPVFLFVCLFCFFLDLEVHWNVWNLANLIMHKLIALFLELP